jgi:DNA repair protein SbcD/Mre11
LRYSGSPLRYSFSERSHDKSVTLVDLPATGSVVETVVSLRQPRGMAELTGTLDELLTAPGPAQHRADWVRVTVTDRARPDQLVDRIKSRFPHALQVFHIPEGQLADEAARQAQLATGPRDIAADFISYVTRLEATSAELDLVDAAYQRALDDLGCSA